MGIRHGQHSIWRGARAAAAGLALLLAAAILPASAAAGTEAAFTFLGGGYGHSVGMSQYGAYGMALDGYAWEPILSHYFTGSSPADADPSLTAEPLWIGLTQERTSVRLTVVATGAAAAAPATFTQGAASIVANQGDTVAVEYLDGGTCRVSGPGGSMEGPCSIDATWDGWEEAPTAALRLEGCTLPDWNAPGGTLWRPCTYAWGTMHVRPDDDTGFDVSVETGLERYILGISESPYAWGSSGGMAALEAQAVAARSYALHRVIERGDPASRTWCWCHLYDTTVDQFYVGWGHATQQWRDAVAATAGKVMTHPSEMRDGALVPIEAFYSSSTFGWTEDSENGFTAYVPYLRAVDDHWGVLSETGNPYARWTATFTASDLASDLGMSSVAAATVTRCSATGAALEITFSGDGGSKAFTTRDLRSRLGLRSMQVYNVGAPPPEAPPCSGYALEPMADGGPVTLASLSIDDDSAGDSRGDGDGVAECGEVVEAFTTIANQGAALAGVTSTLTSADPLVTVRWNTTSSFPDLAAGASATNEADWDLAISPDTPSGHSALLYLQVASGNGGPWDLGVSLPVSCPGTLEGVLASPGDVDGDGTGDAALAYAADGGPPTLKLYSGATGAVLAEARLARAGLAPIDAVTVPDFAGTPADEVAVLLAGDGRASRVVLVDGGNGRRLASIRLSAAVAFIEVEALPSTGGSAAPDLALLSVRPDGRIRVVLRDAATGARIRAAGFGRSLSPAGLAVLPDGAGHDLVVLGTRADGAARAIIRDAADGSLLRRLRLGPSLSARDLAVVDGADGDPVLVALGTDPADGAVRLVTADPATGEILARFRLANLADALDLEPLPDLGGGPGADVAVLGAADDGTAVATVADPVTGSLLAAPEFPGGYLTDDLAALAGGTGLAALGRGTAGSLLTVRHPATGEALISFPVP